MSATFKKFELGVLRVLLPPIPNPDEVRRLARESTVLSYEYTGCGCFLSIRHPNLPTARTVFSEPTVMGHALGVDCGFVVFIQDGELTLECHPWAIDVPERFRDEDVELTVASLDLPP